jgi:hypothetical protein
VEHGADERLVIEQELALLEPEVRVSAERVDAFLHPDFFEFGASGTRWSRAGIIELLAGEDEDSEPIAATDVEATRLADDLIQVTFVTETGGARARRSSLWRRVGDRWLIYFHQGTPIP